MSRKSVLFLSISVNLLFVSFIVVKHFYYVHTGIVNQTSYLKKGPIMTFSVDKEKYDKDHVDLFKAMRHSKSDIVFLGTSITMNFPVNNFFDNPHVRNRGILGNTTSDMLSRISEITDGQPAKLFIEAGTNDLGPRGSVETTFNNLKKIISIVQTNSADTKIYIQSVLPREANKTPLIKAFNTKLAEYCKLKYVTFINLFPYYLTDNSINPALTFDGIHLNAKGYVLYAEKLNPFVKD